MIAESEGIELPELYKDIGYTKSTYFTLTSSQVILNYDCGQKELLSQYNIVSLKIYTDDTYVCLPF